MIDSSEIEILVDRLRGLGLRVVWKEGINYKPDKTDFGRIDVGIELKANDLENPMDNHEDDSIIYNGRRVGVSECYFADGTFVSLVDPILIVAKAFEVVVANCPPVPKSPGIHEKFIFPVERSEDAFEVCLRYYREKPRLIGEWQIPFGRHPHLDIEVVKNSVKNAESISSRDCPRLNLRAAEKGLNIHAFKNINPLGDELWLQCDGMDANRLSHNERETWLEYVKSRKKPRDWS